MILLRYGVIGADNSIPFKITLAGVGVSALVLAAADVQLSLDGNVTFSNIGTEITEIGNGWYLWTPTVVTQIQCKVGVINIKDTSGSSLFDENGIVFFTGGNANARYNGT